MMVILAFNELIAYTREPYELFTKITQHLSLIYQQDNSLTIRHINLQKLVTEMFKVMV